MRIQHNIMAMNAYRNYTNNVSAMKQNLEKLSSGYKINRAGDDAAGLAISEKMRAQITGLETAQKNAKDGISLVQTAEGALTEVHDMLNRMVELATQSANGTYDDSQDRVQLQKEVDQLLDEINRIADSSNFNGIKLLDGTLGLNTDAFEVLGTVDGADGTTVSDIITTDMPAAGATKGTNTILHKDGTAAQLGSFAIDVSQLTATPGAGKTASVDVTIQGLGTAITVAAGATDTVLTGADIADKVKDATSGNNYLIFGADGTTKVDVAANVKEGDLVYQAQSSANGVVTFKAVGYGSADGTVTALTDANLDKLADVDDAAVAVAKHVGTAVSAAATDADTTLTGAENLGTTAPVDTTKPQAGTFGNTKFVIDPSKITEGMSVTIAGETHTFGDDDIKISDLDLTSADGKKDLTERIAKAFENNTNVSVGVDNATVGTLTLAEKTDGKGAAAKSTATAEYQEKMSTLEGFKSLVSFKSASISDGTQVKITDNKVAEGNTLNIDGTKYVFTTDLTGKTDTTDTKYVQFTKDGSDAAANLVTKLTANGVTAENNNGTVTIRAAAGKDAPTILGKGLTLQIGDTSDSYNQLNVAVKDCHTASLGIGNLDISTEENAQAAIAKIKDAINYVSDVRGTLGATQNRLDHTINNLSVMTEHIQDAESTIRDTDVAEEMMAYTKNNILIQSAQAMLAQANQVPQGVLQLLQ